jgi:hypothetical protein
MTSHEDTTDFQRLIIHENQWDQLTDSTKKKILEELPARQIATIEALIDHENNRLLWVCSKTGLLVFTEQISLRQNNAYRKGYLLLHEIKTIDEVEDYFCAYRSRKVTTHSDCFRLTEDLSSAGYSYLQQLISSVKGKNFCLIDNRKIKAVVGENRYRKGKHELITKGLLRPLKTRLKYPYEIAEIHPILAYRGKALDENFDPVWRWISKSISTAEN